MTLATITTTTIRRRIGAAAVASWLVLLTLCTLRTNPGSVESPFWLDTSACAYAVTALATRLCLDRNESRMHLAVLVTVAVILELAIPWASGHLAGVEPFLVCSAASFLGVVAGREISHAAYRAASKGQSNT